MASFQRFAQLMSGENDGPPACVRVREQRLQHGDRPVVERREGFIEQQHFRLVHERARYGQPLPHAARKFADQAIADAAESGSFEPLGGRLFGSSSP